MLVGSRVREARKKKGYSQEELGNILNVTKVSVCGYEKGTRTPTLETFLELIDILDLDVNYALGREVSIVSDNNQDYGVKMSREDVKLVKEIKKNRELYRMLIDDPKRAIELIERKLNK